MSNGEYYGNSHFQGKDKILIFIDKSDDTWKLDFYGGPKAKEFIMETGSNILATGYNADYDCLRLKKEVKQNFPDFEVSVSFGDAGMYGQEEA